MHKRTVSGQVKADVQMCIAFRLLPDRLLSGLVADSTRASDRGLQSPFLRPAHQQAYADFGLNIYAGMLFINVHVLGFVRPLYHPTVFCFQKTTLLFPHLACCIEKGWYTGSEKTIQVSIFNTIFKGSSSFSEIVQNGRQLKKSAVASKHKNKEILKLAKSKIECVNILSYFSQVKHI